MLVQPIPTTCACGNAMVDNRTTKRSEKSPDFRCKNAAKDKDSPGCQIKPIWLKKDHIWSDAQGATVPGSPQYAPASPPTRGPIMAAPVDDVAAHFTLIGDVLLHLSKLHASPDVQKDTFLNEVVSATSMEAVHAIAATIAISRQRNGR